MIDWLISAAALYILVSVIAIVIALFFAIKIFKRLLGK